MKVHAHLEDSPVATKRARNMSREEKSDESAGGKGHRGSLGLQRRKSRRRMPFGGLGEQLQGKCVWGGGETAVFSHILTIRTCICALI